MTERANEPGGTRRQHSVRSVPRREQPGHDGRGMDKR